MMKTRKAAVIGVGHVGAHAASALITQGIVDEVLLIDKNPEKVNCEVQDLNDALLMLPYTVKVKAGDYKDLKDVDVIIHSVGDIELLRGHGDRIFELSFNTKAVDETARKIKDSGFDGVIINISNPCDVITALLAKKTGFPKGRVFGTGTALDSSRLISAIHKNTGVDEKSITAYMMGEHGNEQFAPESALSFKGAPMKAIKNAPEDLNWDDIQKQAINGGWVTFNGKQCTEYGIAATGARLAQAVLRDENLIMPVSAPLNGEFGQSGLFAGVPAMIGKDGVEQIVEIPLTEAESKRFGECCDAIRTNINKAKEILANEK